MKNKAAWIIEWHRHRERLPLTDLRPHILPPAWRSKRVGDYMRCMFWNSPLHNAEETLCGIRQPKPPGTYINKEARLLTYGWADVRLLAYHVVDLTSSRDEEARLVIEWTPPEESPFDGKLEVVGGKRRYVYK